MDLNFVTAFGSDYIRQTEGGLKVSNHTYRVCVELLEAHEAGQRLSRADCDDLHLSILNLEKKDKRDHLLAWYGRLCLPAGSL